FKTVMVAPFSTVNTNTGSYSGSQFYLGYMDDYGALRMTTLNCSGQCRLQAVEAK
ncbi:TPA: molecular chaperone, partial [Escherichia coli]|nr:molecular chaperone [Escherichia coli]